MIRFFIRLINRFKKTKKIGRDIRLCRDNCSLLQPTEFEQNKYNTKTFHYCLAYDRIIKHRGFHPHLVAYKDCIFWSLSKEIYYDSRNN